MSLRVLLILPANDPPKRTAYPLLYWGHVRLGDSFGGSPHPPRLKDSTRLASVAWEKSVQKSLLLKLLLFGWFLFLNFLSFFF